MKPIVAPDFLGKRSYGRPNGDESKANPAPASKFLKIF
jgi:hypothetical protein